MSEDKTKVENTSDMFARNTATITFEGPTGKKLIIEILPVEEGVLQVKSKTEDGKELTEDEMANIHTNLRDLVLDVLTKQPAPKQTEDAAMGKIIPMGAPKGEA